MREKTCNVCGRSYERYSDHVLNNEHRRALAERRAAKETR